ncbi:MAG: hypothetical protein QOJ39_3960, partial [Candidatus Eremiobacteraeota bacterium]|nr:hypothetical protein [Candidatus Eremiobacteraeota bacterium]
MTRRAAALVALAAAWLAPACCAASERPAPSPARAAAAAVESTAIPTAIVDAPIPAATPAPANASLLRPAKLRATFRVPRAATPLYIGTPWFVRDLTATITGPGGRRDTLPATAGLPGHMLGLRLPADAWQADRIDIDATTVSTAAPPYLLTAEQLALIGWRNWPYAALFGLFAALALLAAGLALTRRSAAAGWYAVAAAAQAGLLVPWLGVVRPPPELSQPLHAALQSAVFIALTAFTLAYLRSIRLARSTTTIVWMLVALNVLAAAAGDVLQDLYPLPDLATQAFVAALQLAYVALGITAARNTIPGAWCYLTATSLAALGSLTGAVPSLPAEVQQWTPPAGAAIEALLLALALIALVTRPAAKRTHGEEAADIAHRRTQPDEIEIAPEHDRTPAHRPA